MTTCQDCHLQRPCGCDDDPAERRRVRTTQPPQIATHAPASRPNTLGLDGNTNRVIPTPQTGTSEAGDHRSLALRRDLTAIASAWDELEDALARDGMADRSGVRVPPTSRPPLDPAVADVVAEVGQWVVFLAHVLMDETAWTPPADTSTKSLIDAIKPRAGHFTEHGDPMLAQAVQDDADRYAALVIRTARPSGSRVWRLGLPCLEHATSDMGERVPCRGQYATVVRADETIGDLVCTKDRSHTLTPEEWVRGQRRGSFDEQAVDTLLRQIRVRHSAG